MVRKVDDSKKKLPIFLISGKSPIRNPGGYAAYAHNLAKVFRELGHSVYIIAQGPIKTVEPTDLGEEHLIPVDIINKLSFLKSIELAALPIFSPFFAKEIESIVKEKQYSNFVVWGMGQWSYAGVPLKKKFGDRVKLISFYPTTFLHEMKGSYDAIRISDYGVMLKIQYFLVFQVVSRLYGLLEAQTVKYSDLITLNYKYPESFLRTQFNIDSQKFRQMSYYVEVFNRQSPTATPEKKLNDIFNKYKTLMIVCRQDPRKGINFLLHAFKQVLQKVKSVKLVIVGSGTMLEPNKALSKKLGLEKDVIFTGFVANFESYLRKADIFVFPAIEEGSGSLSVLEAMKFGKAIITTHCDGIPEDIIHNRSGLIVPKMDVISLAQAIIKLFDNPRLMKTFGKNAQKRYEKKYSLKLMANDVKKILHEVSYEK